MRNIALSQGGVYVLKESQHENKSYKVDIQRLNYLFVQYLERACSQEEILELLAYFGTADSDVLAEMIRKELDNDVADTPETTEQTVLFERVGQNINGYIDAHEETEVPRIGRRLAAYAAIAAVAVLFLGAYLFRIQLLNIVDPIKTIELATLKGERKQIRLADGTQIWLSPASELKYPEAFRGDTRELSLNGEAFFEVAHDKSHPFIVHTAKLDTKVLGTSFALQAYSDQVDVNITLLTGKVRVTAINQRTTDLVPNQQAVFNTRDGSLHTTDYPGAAAYLERRDGNLKYKNTPLLTVIRDLQRTFNIRIKLDERMKRCVFYGSFRSSERIATVMQKLVIPYSAHLKQESNNSYAITGKACK